MTPSEPNDALAIAEVRFEHYQSTNSLGVHERTPRLSWTFSHVPTGFKQDAYEIELFDETPGNERCLLHSSKVVSDASLHIPWPLDHTLGSKQRVSARVRVWGTQGHNSNWSPLSFLETGLLSREDWQCKRIASPLQQDTEKPDPEALFRKEFNLTGEVQAARLYITSQGLYEAEIGGNRVGDYFLAPGWTEYDDRLQYQTYDVTDLLSTKNCIGVRVAEGWFSGRLGWGGGIRNIWGSQTALIAQLEIKYTDGHTDIIVTDDTWVVANGPIQKAEIYDGEKYDARNEIDSWSSPFSAEEQKSWQQAVELPWLPESTSLVSGFSEPVRRVRITQPTKQITTPSGKIILDFGQNLVGYARIKSVKGREGQTIKLSHAEVLENGELCTRPLRKAEATDEYTLKGSEQGENWEPRFTFHGFRYLQVDGWPCEESANLLDHFEAVVCHTDMEEIGEFSCSDSLVNKLYKNVVWGMRGNFLSVPTDCPQRDERLGYTGDLAMFAPTASFIYNCYGILKNWLKDVYYTQLVQDGVPAIFAPNVGAKMAKNAPCAIWSDVTILGPWALYEAFGDQTILETQYDSMVAYLKTIPKQKVGCVHLWDFSLFQLGDWLDPTALPDEPWKAQTNAILVANIFLVRVLTLVQRIATIIGKTEDAKRFQDELQIVREEFKAEYVTSNGRLVSDSQTAYALAICFDVLTESQLNRAGERLAEIVRRNAFKIGTGFAGTPFICEALAKTGHVQVAYSMLLNQNHPSWLYPVTMGATTVWERWDSMLPDGSINPGEMTSFNHYAFGAITQFLYERLAGLQCLEPGWKRSRVAPLLGAEFTNAAASHITPYGRVSCSWKIENGDSFKLDVCVPPNTTMEVVLPFGEGKTIEIAGYCETSFTVPYEKSYDWPVKPISNAPGGA